MGRLLGRSRSRGALRPRTGTALHGHPIRCRDSAITNLILLCRWHHTAVHEGGITIDRSPNGREFTVPDGRQPQPWHTSEALAGLLTAHARKAAETITGVDRFDHPAARTIRPHWAGEPFSIHDCVQALFTIRLAEPSSRDQDQQLVA